MRLRGPITRFTGDRRGAVAILFALAVFPLLTAVGAAVDYSRSAQVRTDLQSATDAAAIAIGRAAIELGRTDNKVQARQTFDAGFQRKDGTSVTRFEVTQDLRRIVLEVDARVPLVFAGFLGMNNLDVKARAEVPLDDVTIEVALVLDNTGSMAANGKMTALQTSAKNLITKLQNASTVNTKASIALVPFTTHVNVAPIDPIPWWVRIKPNDPDPKINGVNKSTWRGCILDRDQPHDTRNTRPSTGTEETLFPAAPFHPMPGHYRCQAGLVPVIPLTRDFNLLRTKIDEMTPDGDTNTGIGLAWGFAMLTPGMPMSPTTQAPGRLIKKHILFLTDGINTENRWTRDTALIDQRTAIVCNEIKTPSNGITIHAIRLVDGNETLLQNCATPGKYYSVTNPAQLNAVFDAIAAELLSVRLSY